MGAPPGEEPEVGPPTPAAARRAPGLPRSPWIRGLHLFVLTAFAVAEPLYGILRPKAAFFVVRRSEPLDLLVLVATLGLALPLALWCLAELLGLAAKAAGRLAYGATVLALLALIAAAPLVRSLAEAPAAVVPLALGLGLAGLWLYRRWPPAGSFLSLLAPAPFVFAGLFLLHPSIARFRAGAGTVELLDTGVADAPSVVMVVLDELPLTSLMADERSIDATLFPNFARLAADSTWFRNATASHESTESALPAILTGRRPVDDTLLPTSADHPRSLFTMLGGSHRMKIWETFTSDSPASLAGDNFLRPDPFGARMRSLARDLSVVYAHVVLPRNLSAGLPAVTSNWGGFGGLDADSGAEEARDEGELASKKDAARVGRTEKFMEFVAAVDDDTRPTLYFLHLLTPHGPWNRLRSGRRYDDKPLPSAWAGGVWPEQESYSALAFQRHLMQLGFVDRELGTLLRRLDETGVYDRSLVLLVADHGINFTPGQYGRQTYPDTVRKIAHVPLFIKRPFQRAGQRGGEVSDRNVETIDLLPTVADVLGIELPWAIDGESAFSSAPARREKTVYRRLEPLVLDGAVPDAWPELRRKQRLFGADCTWESCFAVGGQREELGRSLAELEVAPPAGSFVLDRPGRFKGVDPSSPQLPCHVTGHLLSDPLPARVVVALNGVVRAAGYTFDPRPAPGGGGAALFAVMVPPNELRKGANQVDLLGVSDDGRLFALSREAR